MDVDACSLSHKGINQNSDQSTSFSQEIPSPAHMSSLAKSFNDGSEDSFLIFAQNYLCKKYLLLLVDEHLCSLVNDI